MTATHLARAAHAAPPPPRPNWSMIGVLVAVGVHAFAAIWFASALDRRVASIEQQLPPGSMARLDERTLAIQKSVEKLEARR